MQYMEDKIQNPKSNALLNHQNFRLNIIFFFFLPVLLCFPFSNNGIDKSEGVLQILAHALNFEVFYGTISLKHIYIAPT